MASTSTDSDNLQNFGVTIISSFQFLFIFLKKFNSFPPKKMKCNSIQHETTSNMTPQQCHSRLNHSMHCSKNSPQLQRKLRRNSIISSVEVFLVVESLFHVIVIKRPTRKCIVILVYYLSESGRVSMKRKTDWNTFSELGSINGERKLNAP